MNTASQPIRVLIDKTCRRTAGIMSGTSLDGVDVVIADIEGSGRRLSISILGTHFEPYPDELVAMLLRNSAPDSSSVRDISQLNFRLSTFYADCVVRTCVSSGLDINSLDLIGCHGQTVYHVPEVLECAGAPVVSTLQLGDGSVLAAATGVPAVTNFRSADMALGGQGAPLVPYFDFVRFTSEKENRVLLNLGGIANLTVLKSRPLTKIVDGMPRVNVHDSGLTDVVAFDTGPANIVMNEIARRRLSVAFDEDGTVAATGKVNATVLSTLLDNPYFSKSPPKSTGRELFDAAFVDDFIRMMKDAHTDSVSDLMATALAFTVESVAQALERFVFPDTRIDHILVSGGGARNPTLMKQLLGRLAPMQVDSLATIGEDPDYKEALCFAVLAHEFVNGMPTNVPSVTGASRPAILGEVAFG